MAFLARSHTVILLLFVTGAALILSTIYLILTRAFTRAIMHITLILSILLNMYVRIIFQLVGFTGTDPDSSAESAYTIGSPNITVCHLRDQTVAFTNVPHSFSGSNRFHRHCVVLRTRILGLSFAHSSGLSTPPGRNGRDEASSERVLRGVHVPHPAGRA